MAPSRSSRHNGYRRTHHDQQIQGFRIPDILHSLRYLRTNYLRHDPARCVLESVIREVYTKFRHIEHPDNPGFSLDNLLQLIPLRIQSYPDVILRVIYDEGDENEALGEPGQGVGGEGGEEGGGNGEGDDAGDGPEDDAYMTDGDDEFEAQDTKIVTYSEGSYSMMASLSLPSLTPTSQAFAGSPPVITRHFVAIPMSTKGENGNVLPMELSSWKVFKVCTNARSKPTIERWNHHLIHEQSYGVVGPERVARFIDLFGPVLLSKAKWFLMNLRKDADSSSTAPPSPMSERLRVVSHLRVALSLDHDDQVEQHLEQTINNLKDSIAYYHKSSGSSPSKRKRLTQSDLVLLSSYLHQEESKMMEIREDGVPDACLTADGRMVCFHHYTHLHPGVVRHYVEEQTSNIASFDIYTGKLIATLKSEEQLTVLCSVVPYQVGFVSEFDVKVDWEASVEDINRLHAFAGSLGIGTMTISDGDGSEAPDTTGRSVADETSHVRQLLMGTIANLQRVNVVWASQLNISALLQEMLATRRERLDLTIKDSRLEVSSVMHDGHLGVSHIKLTFGDLPSVSEEPFLVGKAQCFDISSGVNWGYQTKDAITRTLQETIQGCPAITAMIVDCPATAHAFKSVPKAIDGIVRPLNNGTDPRLEFSKLILKNNTENDVAAIFDLSQPSLESSLKPLALDVTARSTASLSSLLRGFGPFIRVLHLIGLSPGCPNLIEDLFYSGDEPDKLVCLTLLLDQVKGTNVDHLVKLQSSSMKTFKQLALVAQPQHEDAADKILRSLEVLDETIKGVQVIVTRTQTTGVDDWIEKVRGAMEKVKESTLIVVESAEELARIVPGFTDAGLECLKDIFARPEMPGRLQGEQVTKITASSPKEERSS